MSQKQVMPKSEDLSRSLEINTIWTFDTEFPNIFNKSCTYITFKSAGKHRQLGYGYPRGQTVHLAEATGYVSLFRRPIIPTTHCSDSPLFRRPIGPTAHYSDHAYIIICIHFSICALFSINQ